MEDVSRRIRILLDTKEAEGSIVALKKQMRLWTADLEKAEVGSEKYNAALKKIKEAEPILAQHKQSLRGIAAANTEVATNSSKMVGLAAKVFTVGAIVEFGSRVFDVGKELANTAFQQEALANKAQTVLGPALDSVTLAAERHAAAMGLTTAEYVAAATSAADLLIPMGFQRQAAADISTSLVDLSGALSEWTGGQKTSKEVSDTLTKALLGEREELKGLGIAISEDDVKRRLQVNGMEKATGQALEQAKATATLQLITEKSADAQAAYANGADSNVRRVAELNAQFADLKERLANALLPVFSSVLSTLGDVGEAFGGITDGITAFLDPAKAASDAFDEQRAKVGDLERNVAPLLDRYDELQGKTNLSAAEQTELKKIIEQVSGTIPTAVSGFDAYGKALGLNTDAAREFIEVEKARLKFVNEGAIAQNDALKKQLEEEAKLLQGRLQLRTKTEQRPSSTGFGTTSTAVPLSGDEISKTANDLGQLQERIKGVGAELSRLRGDTLDAAAKVAEPVKTAAAVVDDPAAGQKRTEKAAKEREKALEELADLSKFLAEKRAEFENAQSDDELVRILAQVDKEYAAKLEKIIELEKKGVAGAAQARADAEGLIREERAAAEEEYREAEGKKQVDYLLGIEEELAKVAEDRKLKEEEERARVADERVEMLQKVHEELLSEQELEIEQLNAHYTELLNLAGLSEEQMVALKAKQAEKLAAIDKKYADESLAKVQTDNQKKLAAQQALFQGLGELAMATGELFAGEAGKNSRISKIATLAQIAIDTASAIASLTRGSEAAGAAAGPAAPFVAAAAFAAGLARILVNVKKAKDLLTTAPEVPQKATGGWTEVVGEDDRRTYQARYIGQVGTGMLEYDHPVVLANEGGRREYFVDARSLEDPVVREHVEAIERAKSGNLTPYPLSNGEGRDAGSDMGASPPTPSPKKGEGRDAGSDMGPRPVPLLRKGEGRDAGATAPSGMGPHIRPHRGGRGVGTAPERFADPDSGARPAPLFFGEGVGGEAHVVLANEGGRKEYFVDADTLADPVVMHHVRAIEQVRSERGAVESEQGAGSSGWRAAPVLPSPVFSVAAPGHGSTLRPMTIIPAAMGDTAPSMPGAAAMGAVVRFADPVAVREPVTFNHRQSVANVERTRTVTQMAEGGFTQNAVAAPPMGGAPNEMAGMMNQMMALLARLDDTLNGGLMAVIEDRTVVDIANRQAKIAGAAGGGVLGRN